MANAIGKAVKLRTDSRKIEIKNVATDEIGIIWEDDTDMVKVKFSNGFHWVGVEFLELA